MESSPSVRIEVEDVRATEREGNPGPVGGPGRSGVGVSAAAFAIIALVIGLVLLRPSDGRAADGLERQAPTTTTTPPTTSTALAAEVSTASLISTNAQSVGFFPLPNGITSTADGFLGLGQVTTSHPFALFRSFDGIEWAAVDATVNGIEPVVGEAEFSHLQRVAGGFALLRTTQLGETDSTSAGAETIVERLVSPDGVSWSLDESFAPIRRSGDVSPAFHFGDVVGVTVIPDEVPIPLDGLFADALVADSGVPTDGICGLDRFFTFQTQSTGFRTVPCGDSEDARIAAVDSFRISDPHSANAILDCAELLTEVTRRRNTSMILSRDGVVERDRLGLLTAAAYVALSDGTIAGVADADEYFPGFAACEAFPDAFKNPRPTLLKWLTPDGETRSLGVVSGADPAEAGVAPLSVVHAEGDDLLVLYEASVWRYDLMLGGSPAMTVGDLPVAQHGWHDFVFLDGERGIGVAADLVSVVDLATSVTRTVEVALGSSPEILFADADRAFIQSDGPDGPLQLIENLSVS